MTKVVRDIMTGGVECIGENDTISDAARRLAELDVGSMPICGEDNRLKGMVTDRDIVVKVVAEAKDPDKTKVREVAQGKPVTIGADDPVDAALQTMMDHKIRRLPVIDGHDLVGIVSQCDIALAMPEDRVGELVAGISSSK